MVIFIRLILPYKVLKKNILDPYNFYVLDFVSKSSKSDLINKFKPAEGEDYFSIYVVKISQQISSLQGFCDF